MAHSATLVSTQSLHLARTYKLRRSVYVLIHILRANNIRIASKIQARVEGVSARWVVHFYYDSKQSIIEPTMSTL